MTALIMVLAFVVGFNACHLLDRAAGWWVGQQITRLENGLEELREPWWFKVWRFFYCERGDK